MSFSSALQQSPRFAWLRELAQSAPESEKMRALNRRLAVAWWILAAGILAWGAFLRLRLPREPVIDPDIEGYLGPAISALSGHGFVHLLGRSFPYPAFVYAVLRVFGDFRAIAVIQHLLGLAAGAIVLLAWNAAGRLVPAGGFPKAVYPFLGLAPAFTYLGSERMVLFEHALRPEAIFPFFCILTLWIGFLFIDARFIRPGPGAALWLGALNVFLACLLYETKPSFGIAVLFCTLPVWLSLFSRGAGPNRLLLLAAVILPPLLLLVLPENALKKSDRVGKTFLPETLFTIHASIIERQMAEDLASSGPLPFPRDFLQTAHDLLKSEMAKAAHVTEPKAFTTLGTNPDFLMYKHSFVFKLIKAFHLNRQQMANFCFTYYRRALIHHPGAMAWKVLRQLGLVYQPKCPIYWVGPVTNLSADHYARVERLAQHTAKLGTPGLPVLARYVEECNRLAQENLTIVQSAAFTDWLHVLAPQHLLFLVFALVSPLFLFRKPELRAHFFWLVMAVWLAYGYGLGNNLTIAIIHTLEVTRYVHIQLITAVFAQTLGFYLLLEMISLRVRAVLTAQPS